MGDFFRKFTLVVLSTCAFLTQAGEGSVAQLEQQANLFLTNYQQVKDDVSQISQLELDSQTLLKKLQQCEQQAETELDELTVIREIEVLKSDSQDSSNKADELMPSSQATAEVDRLINDASQHLITCRLKSRQVSSARFSLLNQKQNIWLQQLTERQDVWSFIRSDKLSQITADKLHRAIPANTMFIALSLLVLASYGLIYWLNRSALCDLQNTESRAVNLSEVFKLLLKLFFIPFLLAWTYYFLAGQNRWHLLVLVGSLLVRDFCALLAIKPLLTDEEIKPFKRFMWVSGVLMVLIAVAFNGIELQHNKQTQWLNEFSIVLTPLFLLVGVFLAFSSYFFYRLIKPYKDRFVPAVILVLALISTLAYVLSYANGAQYILLLSTGVLLVHWCLKSLNGLRKVLLSKKITQLKQLEQYAGETFAFPFWVSLFTAMSAGAVGLVFLAWLAGINDEAYKQISFVFNEGFAVGSVRLVPKDILIGAAIITVLIVLLSVIKSGIQNKWLDKSRLSKSSREIFSMIVWYIGITIAVFIGLTVAGFDVSKLAIIAGALSVGIGFGLKNIVSNFVSGLILLFERPITRGDWVEVGDTVGLIEKINIRATRIRTFDNAQILVPNSELLSHHLTNWTLSNSIGRITLKVGVAYGSDVNQVREILDNIAKNHDEVLQRAPYQHKVLFREFGDSSLNFELRVMVKDIKLFLDLTSELNFAIDQALRDAEISIPFPQRDLHIIDSRKLDAQATENADKEDGNHQPVKQNKTNGEQSNNSRQSSEDDKGEVEQMVEEDEKRKKAEQQAAQQDNDNKD